VAALAIHHGRMSTAALKTLGAKDEFIRLYSSG
jgi:hypothetical protein